MDHKDEYHDPDYAGTSSRSNEGSQKLSEDEKFEKIKKIVRREFTNELEVRENEVMQLDQRMTTYRRLLHRLRYSLVNKYFSDQKLQLTAAQIQDEVAAQHEPRARNEVSSMLRESQRRVHPSVRKLLGKKTVDLDEILFTSSKPRNKVRRDYSAMLQTRNYTIAADATRSLRPTRDKFSDIVTLDSSSWTAATQPKKVPRQIDPKIVNVVTLDEATRNQMKHRYRIIIGNTSKYAPAASTADRSTHKWLLYVRGAGDVDISKILTAVCVRLHHSYAPHHTVRMDKPPFHISRRGWGEFPARVELHFPLPTRNRPATLEHTIKLDRNYTGLQTLGAETVIDVWLYSTPEMLQYEFKENIEIPPVKPDNPEPKIEPQPEPIQPKTEPVESETEFTDQNDTWLDFFNNTTELDVDEMIIKPNKKVEEKNDMESLIETNIISKESTEETDKETKIANQVKSENIKEEITKSNGEAEVIMNHKPLGNYVEDLPNELLTQPTSPKKRIMKYMDPTTGKIYYLEMDRNLDLSKVQEIVINSKGNVKTAKISPIKPNGLKNVRKNVKKTGISLLKPEVKSLLKNENSKDKQKVVKNNFTHIENDHCYIKAPSSNVTFSNVTETVLPNNVFNAAENVAIEEDLVKKEENLYECLSSTVKRFTSVKVAVNYLLKKIPIISSDARDPDFVKQFPFVVDNEEKYWKLDFAKRRNIEWSRAKLINKLLTTHFTHEPTWRTKQILIYSRLHGFYPIRTETIQKLPPSDYSWTDLENSRMNIKNIYPNPEDISTLTVFNPEDFTVNLSESLDISSDEEIEVVSSECPVKVKKEVEQCSELTVLPVESDEDRLRFLFVEKMCADIGIELRNEDVGNGYSYSAVHAVLLSAMKSFSEELVRSALAAKLLEPSGQTLPPVWVGSSSTLTTISLQHAVSASRNPRLHALSARAMGAPRKDTYNI